MLDKYQPRQSQSDIHYGIVLMDGSNEILAQLNQELDTLYEELGVVGSELDEARVTISQLQEVVNKVEKLKTAQRKLIRAINPQVPGIAS